MSKSSNKSAFLILCRAILLAGIFACTSFFMEIFFLGLMPVISSQLTNPALWVLPAGTALFAFLWCLFSSGIFRTFMVLCLCGAMVCSVYFQSPGLSNYLFGQLMDTRIHLQRYMLADDPEFPNTWLVQDKPFAMYYVDDGNTEVTVSQSLLDSLSEFTAGLPDVLLKNCSAIYFMEEPAFEAMDEQYENSSVFGVSKSSNFTISIRLVQNGAFSYTYMHDGTAVTLDNPLFYTETIVHELVHLADMKQGYTGTLPSESEPYVSWYSENPELFGSYGATSPVEWFAEAGVCYFLYPDMLLSKHPDLYESLNDFFYA